MVYTPLWWASGVNLDCFNMNHLETQYAEIKSWIDSHSHTDRYYTEEEADAKYFYADHMDDFNADTIDGLELSAIAEALLPSGAVVPWGGALGSIPDGWTLCDGTSGTPNLSDKFVIGAGTLSVGDSVGASTSTITARVTLDSTTLSLSEIASHTHTVTDHYGAAYTLYGGFTTGKQTSASLETIALGSTGGGSGHTHAEKACSCSAFNNNPYYYTLAYIMKV